jgi:uncharacterized metal-binding protein
MSQGNADQPLVFLAMPSGHTHDQITYATLPIVVGFTLGFSRNFWITLGVSTAFLFSGLMFGPDLDLPSCQYRRWGWLRWVWLPYQRSLRHRSVWSHGFLVGTLLRVIYLGSWITLPLLSLAWLGQHFGYLSFSWQQLWQNIYTLTLTHLWEGLAILLGLELGAMSHYSSDWIGSTLRRWQRPKRRIKRYQR